MADTKLTPLKVDSLSQPGRYADGKGLYLNISKDGTKSWLYRYQIKGRRRWMGLGGYDKKTNTLKMARIEASRQKLLINDGKDPLDVQRAKDEAEKALRETVAKAKRLENMTFELLAGEYIANKKSEWSNAKHRQQWTNTLTQYAFPYIGSIPVNNIDTDEVRKCLDPIWHVKTETAKRVRQRIEAVLDYAKALKFREGDNPARWAGLLDKMYPTPAKITKVKHHNALPYQDMPVFMSQLREMDGVAATALRFTILTASRTSEVRFSTWDEFDLDKKVWNIPGERMKAGKDHRVALSDAVVKLLKDLPRIEDYVFPGRSEKPMSDGGMSSVLKRMERQDITVHGFRSTFRDYIGEETGFPHRIAEFALAHGLTDEAEKAYARGDLLKKRFKMMNAWAAYCDSKKAANVTPIKSRKSG